MLHTLRLSRRARGIQNEQRVFRCHDFGFCRCCLVCGQFAIPNVASRIPRHLITGAFDGDYAVDVWAVAQSLINIFFEWDDTASAYTLVSRDDGPTIGVEYSILQRLWGKTAKDNAVYGANARTGKHCVGSFGNHGHIDTYSIALFDAALAQSVGKLTDPFVKLLVGDMRLFCRFIAFPDNGCLIGSCG